ncbi:MAG: hypothetical protein WC802_00850 [Patescibacteria group bacterium]|jgi:hypothetical protein
MLSKLLKLFGFTLAIYFINFFGAKAGVYGVWPYFDIPMHFLGGASIAVMGLVAWDMGLGYGKRSLSSIPFLVKTVAVIGFVAIVGIVWEWYEFIHDFARAFTQVVFTPAQPSIGDTMKDLFFDLFGAMAAFACSYITFRKKS